MKPPTEQELAYRAHQGGILQIMTYGGPQDPFAVVRDTFEHFPDGTCRISRDVRLRASCQFLRVEFPVPSPKKSPDAGF